MKHFVIAAVAATGLVVLATSLYSEPLLTSPGSPPAAEPITGEPA